MALINLVYVSLASHDMSDNELREILNVARTRNQELNITGMLLYRDGYFIQALEGEENAVVTLYEKICHDPRHNHIITVEKRPITERIFSSWTMGFNKLGTGDLETIPGYTDYLKRSDTSLFAEHPDRVTALLDRFKDRTYF